MKKLALMIIIILLVGMAMMVAQEGQQPAQQPPPARKIPGITVPDNFPHACVDCHLNYVEMKLDTRFSTLMQHWTEMTEPKLLQKARAAAPEGLKVTGKHPPVGNIYDDIPGKCLVCHNRESKIAPPFARMLHKIHLTGGEENHFLTLFQGECTHCHKLDQATGRWVIPSGPEK